MKYIFGNWKSYLDCDESLLLARDMAELSIPTDKMIAAVFPNFLSLHAVIDALQGSSVLVGAQNVSFTPQGAYTGAVSAYLLKSIGCRYVIVGHSEERYVFGEHDPDIRKKVEECLKVGLTPILCIGETKEDLEAGKRQYRLKKQLLTVFDGLSWNGGQIIIAYEPVWAIGTGTPCNPAEADDVHGWVKQEIAQYGGNHVPVLYGGSVDEKNVLSYVSRETIDGVLVGSASVKRESWKALLTAGLSLAS